MQGRIEGFEKTPKNIYILGAIYIYSEQVPPSPQKKTWNSAALIPAPTPVCEGQRIPAKKCITLLFECFPYVCPEPVLVK